jgi:hypothetical protein
MQADALRTEKQGSSEIQTEVDLPGSGVVFRLKFVRKILQNSGLLSQHHLQEMVRDQNKNR